MLTNITKGQLHEPLRCLFYGAHATGKTTLASGIDHAVFIDTENGSAHLDVARVQFRDESGGHVPQSYQDVVAAIDELLTAEHSFRTLVIDSVDRLEALLWRHVCELHSGKKSGVNKAGKKLDTIEELPYGAGFAVALDQWRILCAKLDELRLKRGMTIVLVGHAQTKLYKSPVTDDYDRIQLRLHKLAAGFLSEWSDLVGYVAFEEGAGKLSDEDERAKGWDTGKRYIHFRRTAVYDAKSRLPLPYALELPAGEPWQAVTSAIHTARDLSATELRERIAAELNRLGDSNLQIRVESAVKSAGENTATLSRYLNDLKQRESNKEQS